MCAFLPLPFQHSRTWDVKILDVGNPIHRGAEGVDPLPKISVYDAERRLRIMVTFAAVAIAAPPQNGCMKSRTTHIKVSTVPWQHLGMAESRA